MAYRQSKTEHAFQIFHKDLKNSDFPPVLFMYGEEEYLSEWAVKSLAERYTDQAMRDMDFVRLSEEEALTDKIIEACETLSIFSERRIIWVRNFGPVVKKNSKGFGEAELEKLSGYMDDPNDRAILVFSCAKAEEGAALTKLIKKKCRCYNFDRLDIAQLTAFAEKRFKAAGAAADRAHIKYFIEETGYFNRESDYKIFNLENDIKKLLAYCGGRPVTREDIDRTLHGDMDSFAFNFLDAMTSGKKDAAFRLLYNMIGSGNEFYSILGLLVNQFELMYEAKELKDEGMSAEAAAKTLKVNGYRVKKALAVADRLSYKKIREILSQLYETDRNIKTGMMEHNLALELLIGRM